MEKSWFLKAPFSWVANVEDESNIQRPQYGNPQDYFPEEPNGERLIHLLTPENGSTIHILTSYFDSDWHQKEGGNSKNCWVRWLYDQITNNNVRLRVVGHPLKGNKIEEPVLDSLDYLKNSGGDVQLKIVDEMQNSHAIIVSTPIQLWVEEIHKNKEPAKHCYFTKRPYPEPLKHIYYRFKDSFQRGETLKIQDFRSKLTQEPVPTN